MTDLICAGVISDSHGLLRPRVLQELEDCTHILHAGDIVRETDLDALRVMGRIYAVRGNCDLAPWAWELRDMLRFEIGGVRFLMLHDRRSLPRNLEGVDAVIHGHTHHFAEERTEGRLWLNPGTCGVPRFGTEVTMAKLLIRNGRIEEVRRIDLQE